MYFAQIKNMSGIFIKILVRYYVKIAYVSSILIDFFLILPLTDLRLKVVGV
jgi:hypothetical protein